MLSIVARPMGPPYQGKARCEAGILELKIRNQNKTIINFKAKYNPSRMAIPADK